MTKREYKYIQRKKITKLIKSIKFGERRPISLLLTEQQMRYSCLIKKCHEEMIKAIAIGVDLKMQSL